MKLKRKITVSPWDASETLKSEEEMASYLSAALEDGDPVVIKAAMADVAKARNMTQLAKKMGITRQGLYKAFSPEGNPEFITINKFLNAVGVRLSVVPMNVSA